MQELVLVCRVVQVWHALYTRKPWSCTSNGCDFAGYGSLPLCKGRWHAVPEGLWARADCGVETVRSPEGCARFDNPSVSFADSSLYTREPKSGWSVYGDDFLCTREPKSGWSVYGDDFLCTREPRCEWSACGDDFLCTREPRCEWSACGEDPLHKGAWGGWELQGTAR